MLTIENLHATADGKPILNGLDLQVNAGEVHAVMGPNGSGKSTLSYVIAGREGYEVTQGSITYQGKDLLAMSVEERALSGVFLAFQYPVEIPGVGSATFLKTAVNAARKHRGEKEYDAMEFLKVVKAKRADLGIDDGMMRRALNVGFSGGEKKRNEMLQMALLEPTLAILDEDRFRPRHRRAEDRRQRYQRDAYARARHGGHHPLPAAPRPRGAGQGSRALGRSYRPLRRERACA